MRARDYPLSPPLRGQRSDVAPFEIPEGYAWRISNVTPHFGRLDFRPGLTRLSTVDLNGPIRGGHSWSTTAGARRAVAATKSKWYRLTGTSAWTDITPVTQLTSTDDDHVRFTVFPTAGVNLLLGTNNVDTPKKWNGTDATFSDVGGTPPVCRDLCVLANRVVAFNVNESGTRSPSRARASDLNDPDTWPAGLVANLTDTNDDGVAIRTHTRTTGLAYKTGSIWAVIAQAGVFPFRFEVIEHSIPGPCSTAAVVSTGGVDYYLGVDARIYRVSLGGIEAISEGVDRAIQEVFKHSARGRAWGLYRRQDRSVWFFFASGASDDPELAVSYHLREQGFFLHTFAQKLTAGWIGDELNSLTWDDLAGFTWATIAATYPTWESFSGSQQQTEFLGGRNGRTYRFLWDSDDAGTAITASWETPPRAHAGSRKRLTFDGIEHSFEETAAGPSATISIGVTDTGAEEEPTYTEVGTHDTSLATRQFLDRAGSSKPEGRLLNQKVSVVSGTGSSFRAMGYQGALLYLSDEDTP